MKPTTLLFVLNAKKAPAAPPPPRPIPNLAEIQRAVRAHLRKADGVPPPAPRPSPRPLTAREHTLATGPHATPAITHREMNLLDGGQLHQPSQSRAQLFRDAAAHKEHLDNVIDRGKGVSAVLGFHVVEGRGLTLEDYAEGHRKGGLVHMAPLKSQCRTDQKVKDKYDGDYARVRDISRASIAVSHPGDIPHVMHHLRQHGLNIGSKPDDRFAHPTEAGYSDLQVEHVAPNGHRGELQIHSLDHLQAKQEGFLGVAGGVAGHKIFEEIRSMPRRAADRTDSQNERVHQLNADSQTLYGEATNRAVSRTPRYAHLPVNETPLQKGVISQGRLGPTSRGIVRGRGTSMEHNRALEPGWFAMDGLPVRREAYGDTPEFFNGSEWRAVDPNEFAHSASRVDVSRFHELVERQMDEHRRFAALRAH